MVSYDASYGQPSFSRKFLIVWKVTHARNLRGLRIVEQPVVGGIYPRLISGRTENSDRMTCCCSPNQNLVGRVGFGLIHSRCQSRSHFLVLNACAMAKNFKEHLSDRQKFQIEPPKPLILSSLSSVYLYNYHTSIVSLSSLIISQK